MDLNDNVMRRFRFEVDAGDSVGHLRREVRLYTEAAVSLGLLFGFSENEFLDVAVNLILLYAVGNRRSHLGTHETRDDRR